ncbi:MAG: hypothetical protein IKQ08_09215 [Paludibacteraceae bacterium]|nr:hypothetical protein [Paludibacteraceae bacterium]
MWKLILIEHMMYVTCMPLGFILEGFHFLFLFLALGFMPHISLILSEITALGTARYKKILIVVGMSLLFILGSYFCFEFAAKMSEFNHTDEEGDLLIYGIILSPIIGSTAILIWEWYLKLKSFWIRSLTLILAIIPCWGVAVVLISSEFICRLFKGLMNGWHG